MTLQQQAYDLIDRLPEESVRLIVELMGRMSGPVPQAWENGQKKSEKMLAFERMQELRKETAGYGILDPMEEREQGMREKYGVFM